MGVIYGRMARVTIGLRDGAGLTITEPRIRFAVDRTIDKTQDKAEIFVYNLNEQHLAAVRKRGESVLLEAGYRERAGLQIVIEGRIQRLRNLRHGLARILAIEVGDEVHAVQRLRGVYSRAYRGHVNVRQIARDIVERGLELSISDASLQLIPAGATFYNFRWDSQADAALSTLLNSDSCCGRQGGSCTWYEEDGVIRINRPGRLQPDGPTVDVSPDTGLLGVPTRTDEGAQARMFLNPSVRLGGRLNIESATLSGSFKVAAVEHQGDTWATGRGSAFTTFAELREIA